MFRTTTGFIFSMLLLSLFGLHPSPAYAAPIDEKIKIFVVEKKLATTEAEVNEWLADAKPDIISIKLIPATDANTALVVSYKRKTTDSRKQKLKLFQQDERLESYEKRVNRWLTDTEDVVIISRDTTISLNKGETAVQNAYIYAPK
ncbi:MAG: hypothetical protein KBC95_01605 [Candidatus Peribacteraceae bacterium]|nr:hypothetical protein [Candidatus Peribacteraceae bacterium]